MSTIIRLSRVPMVFDRVFRESKHYGSMLHAHFNSTDSTPSPDDWWQKEEEEETNHGKEGKFTKEEMDLASTEEESDQEPKTHFRNIGLENWERSRKQWRKRTVTGKIERPPNIRYDQVVRGLSQVQRTYELPGRMTLPDIINVFIDIWHSY